MFKVFAVGQSIPAGSNTFINLDPATVIEGCGAVLNTLVELPVGEFTAHAEITWAGTPHASRHMTINAFDSGFLNVTTGAQNVTSLDLGPFTVADAPGFVSLFAGVGSGVTGQSITSASFLQISCGAQPWSVGRISWGSRGAWH